jgi:hypothetical protein
MIKKLQKETAFSADPDARIQDIVVNKKAGA